MSGKAEGEGNEPINEQAVANIYGAMRSDINQIYSKITELEMEASEHSLVMNAIKPLDPSRRCYRMIGGVLVERTIKEVLPAVQRNKEGLEEVIARLNEALEKKKRKLLTSRLNTKLGLESLTKCRMMLGGRKALHREFLLVLQVGTNDLLLGFSNSWCFSLFLEDVIKEL
ncbi:putative prefoldin subunit 2 [Camellia lanceoleosa]|uniref:Prefoldin subunit 2 n=1 Tax=Camellia lanceoleosa TaxID=1840588 RepID=A0ACC0GV36_9ERIC|nr:putative prefoldin subunit 2 [Camellia lanceoleosa]